MLEKFRLDRKWEEGEEGNRGREMRGGRKHIVELCGFID